MFFYIGGISGVGKTVAIAGIIQLAREKGIKIEIAPLKEVLCELAGVKTVEEFRALSEEFRSSLHPKAREILYELDAVDSKTIRIYDSHFCSLDQKGEKFIIRPVHVDDKRRVIGVAILVATPSSVVRRRIKDQSIRADRHQFDVDQIAKEQNKEVQVSTAQAHEIGFPLAIFDNTNAGVLFVSEKILTYIRKEIMMGR